MTIIVTGCAYKVKTPILPVSFIETYPLDTTKVKYNGYYNLIADTITFTNGYKYTFPRHITDGLTVFNQNKNVYICGGATLDNSALSCEFYQSIVNWSKMHNEDYLGKYTIKNDSIYAYALAHIVITAGRVADVYCNYRGFVKNRDTITDWKVIPPYSKDFTKFVIENNQSLLNPHTLYFVKTDAVKCLEMD